MKYSKKYDIFFEMFFHTLQIHRVKDYWGRGFANPRPQ